MVKLYIHKKYVVILFFQYHEESYGPKPSGSGDGTLVILAHNLENVLDNLERSATQRLFLYIVL